MDTDTDRELAALLAEAQRGDQDAYERFLLGAAGAMRPVLRARMRDDEAAEDVLQETLLSVHRARHTYLPGRPVGPWLHAIRHHRMIDYYRRRRRIERVEISAPEGVADAVPAPAPRDGDLERLARETLGRLPDRQRRVVELLKVQGLSVKEAAARTGMSESAVKVTAFRGVAALRRIFGVR